MNNIIVFFILLLIYIIYIYSKPESYTNEITNLVYKWSNKKI